MMMMKNWFSRSVLLASGVALCLSAAPAWAALPVLPRFVPGVSAMGNLDDSLGAVIKIKAKLTINTNNGTMYASGNGGVTNLSGAGHGYNNISVIIPGMVVTSNQYYVFRSGACRLAAKGNVAALM